MVGRVEVVDERLRRRDGVAPHAHRDAERRLAAVEQRGEVEQLVAGGGVAGIAGETIGGGEQQR